MWRLHYSWDWTNTIILAVLGALGFGFAILMPPFQFNDEHAHFVRAYEISRGDWIGRPDPRTPADVFAAIQRYPERTEPAGSTAEFSGARLVADTRTVAVFPGPARGSLQFFKWGLLASQSYWPVAYAPASIGIAIASIFDLPVTGMLYAGRCVNVLCFLAAVAATLLLAPQYRGLLAAVALMPMTVLQAAAVSADQVTIALALLVFGLVLRAREAPVSWRYLAVLLIVAANLALCKYSLWVLPLLLLIPDARFGGRSRRVAYLLAVVLVTAVLIVGWRHLTSEASAAHRLAGLSRGIDFTRNTRLFLNHPLAVVTDITAPTGFSHLAYLEMMLHRFIGVFGWRLAGVPHATPYLVMLLAVALVEVNPKPFSAMERLLLLAIFLGAVVATYFVLYVIDGVYSGGHAGFSSAGVQGRYMIPYCLAGLLAINQKWFKVSSRVLASIVPAVAAIYGVLAFSAISRFYYR